MEYPLAEVIDRLTILYLKCARLPLDPAIAAEADRLRDAMLARPSAGRLQAWYETLLEVNGQIWDLEADIRAGRDGKLRLEEIGRRALAIRDINGERVRIKAEIARAVGEFAELKVDHASAIP
jgi:hypothetical protein